MIFSYVYTVCTLLAFIIGYIDCASKSSNNDLSLNTFTTKGEISQISYAYKKVEKGLPCIAWHDEVNSAIVLISNLNIGSDVRVPCNYNSYITDDGIVAIATGYSPDCTAVFKYLNTIIQREKESFGYTPSLNKVNHALSKWLTRGLYGQPDDDDSNQSSRMEEVRRPFAASAFIATYDTYLKALRLSYIENSGMYQDCEFGCFGKISKNTLVQIKQDVFSKDSLGISLKQRINNVLKSLSENFDMALEDARNEIAYEIIIVKKDSNIEKFIVSPEFPFDKLNSKM